MTTEVAFPGLGIHHGWTEGEDGWDVGMETNFRLLNTLIQARAIALQNAAPGGPSEGDTYIVGTAGSGAFATHNNAFAAYYGATWYFYTPLPGFLVFNEGDGSYYSYDGSAWSPLATGGGGNSTLQVFDHGSSLTASASSIDFEGSGLTISASGDDITVTASGGGGGGGATVALVSGDTPGPALMADGFGQTIGVPLGTDHDAGSTIADYLATGTFADRPASPSVAPGAVFLYLANDTGITYFWDGSWHQLYF